MPEPPPPPPPLDGYTRERFLGSGASGAVYAEREAASGLLLAVKYVPLSRMIPFKRFRRELLNARRASAAAHPAVACFVRAAPVRTVPTAGGGGRASSAVWGAAVVSELCDGEMLLDWVNREWAAARARADVPPERRRPDEALLRAAFVQVLSGVAALHALGIAHRDIKARQPRRAGARAAQRTRAALLRPRPDVPWRLQRAPPADASPAPSGPAAGQRVPCAAAVVAPPRCPSAPQAGGPRL